MAVVRKILARATHYPINARRLVISLANVRHVPKLFAHPPQFSLWSINSSLQMSRYGLSPAVGSHLLSAFYKDMGVPVVVSRGKLRYFYIVSLFRWSRVLC